ncbi:MAG: sigma-70 family RNA polymerase sigma factor [Elusimicrobiota bacterium]
MTDSVKIQEEKKVHTKTELAEQYEYLVGKISEQFNEASESRENLEEAGYIGLLNAVNLYNEKIHQMNFKTYAQILITEEMHQYLMNRNRQVNTPDWLVRLNHKIDQFVIDYREKNQSFPPVSEIASYLNINTVGLQEVLKSRNSIKDSHFGKKFEQDLDISEIQPNLNRIKNQSPQSFKLPIEDLITLQKAFKRIKTLQEGIVYYLFVMDLSETKLAKMLGISTKKVDQLKKEVQQNLRS